MKFIQYPDQDAWWEWVTESMKAYNYMGGYHNINENGLGDCSYIEAKDWHDLYLKTGYNPMERSIHERDVWISPDGKFYDGEAHSVTAEHICEILFGEWMDIDHADDYLVERGWIKASTSFMWDFYYEESLSFRMLPNVQYNALWDWCQLHGKEFPIGIDIAD